VEISINGSPKVVRPRRRSKTHTYYAPRVLCLLSTWPYLSAFRTYLTELYRLATCTTNFMKAPIERYILNICAEVPAPPPGSFEVQLSILDSTIRFWAPPADQPVAYVSLTNPLRMSACPMVFCLNASTLVTCCSLGILWLAKEKYYWFRAN